MEWLQYISISTTLWVILGVANYPIYTWIGNYFFDTSDDFWDCVKFTFQPDLVSLFTGEFVEDFWQSMKLAIFLAIIGAVVTSEHTLITYLLNEYVIEMNDATLYQLIFETT